MQNCLKKITIGLAQFAEKVPFICMSIILPKPIFGPASMWIM